jgi:hypothetical protein
MLKRILSSIALLFVSCAEGTGNFQVESAPRVQLTESGRPVYDGDILSIRVGSVLDLEIENVGNGPLKVYSIAIEDGAEENFELIMGQGPTRENPIIVQPLGPSSLFQIAQVSSIESDGLLVITTNQTLDGTNKFEVLLRSEVQQSGLVIQPKIVDFGIVQSGVTGIKPVSLLNVGLTPATVSKIIFSGRTDFWASLRGEVFEVTGESSTSGILLDPPLLIDPGSVFSFDVYYRAVYPDEARAKMIFVNDSSGGSDVSLDMIANVEGPCLKVTPTRVNFGGKNVGQQGIQDVTLENCNSKAVEVFDAQIVDDLSGAFGVDTSLVSLPLSLSGNSRVTLPVTYTPQSVSTQNADGSYVTDTAKLRVSSDSFVPDYDVDLSGFGTDGTCPTAVIAVTQGEEVAPQTVLNLSAASSTSTVGSINRWEWSVVQPQGSASVFLPTASRRDVSFEANIVGEYIFRLKVWNSLGVESCAVAEKIVRVVSDSAIRVELLWSTPGDRNQFDVGFYVTGESVGSDVDLHFLRPGVAWDYFGQLDCHWLNPMPDWGMRGPTHDPSLDRDDTDGAGPENLNMNIPENTQYRVGVHYWDDWGFGPSWITIRVYIFGQLREQWSDVVLQTLDLWDALLIDWPSGVVTRIGDGVNPEVFPGIF